MILIIVFIPRLLRFLPSSRPSWWCSISLLYTVHWLEMTSITIIMPLLSTDDNDSKIVPTAVILGGPEYFISKVISLINFHSYHVWQIYGRSTYLCVFSLSTYPLFMPPTFIHPFFLPFNLLSRYNVHETGLHNKSHMHNQIFTGSTESHILAFQK